MILLHSIRDAKPTSNYNLPSEVQASKGPLSFDGVYLNVWENRHILKGRGGILFVVGDWIGKDNRPDVDRYGQPFEQMCGWTELYDLEAMGLEIGWHTWSHPNLTEVDDETLAREVTPPFPMRHFAYPYGKFDSRVIRAVEKAGFEEAWTAGRGDGSQFQRRRWHL
jgi:peptidoglycan/xylan/chitin deacetylase (PgdA/CDA1 family)